MCILVFFLMIRRPPRSTLDRSSAASDVYKSQVHALPYVPPHDELDGFPGRAAGAPVFHSAATQGSVSYTHLRAHETVLDLVCRLLLEKKKYCTSH